MPVSWSHMVLIWWAQAIGLGLGLFGSCFPSICGGWLNVALGQNLCHSEDNWTPFRAPIKTGFGLQGCICTINVRLRHFSSSLVWPEPLLVYCCGQGPLWMSPQRRICPCNASFSSFLLLHTQPRLFFLFLFSKLFPQSLKFPFRPVPLVLQHFCKFLFPFPEKFVIFSLVPHVTSFPLLIYWHSHLLSICHLVVIYQIDWN